MATLKPTDECIIKRLGLYSYRKRYGCYIYKAYSGYFAYEGPKTEEFGYVKTGKNYKHFYILFKDHEIKGICYESSLVEIKNIPLWRKRYFPKIRCGSCVHKHIYKLTGKCEETYKWRH